jgi:Sec-independent protein translocase protein TatA
MFLLSPAKLLVVLVVALAVLGPDKLPKVAKQLGELWADIRRFREKLESEVRSNLPDLPSADALTQAVRSPLTFLESLAADNPRGEAVASHGPTGVGPDTPYQHESDTQTSGCPGSTAPDPVEFEDPVDSRRHGSHPIGVAHQIRPEELPGLSDSELN